MTATRYPIPAARHRVEQVIDRSRFICTVLPVTSVAEAQAFVRDIGDEFPDATHHCWAYLVGPPGSTDRIGFSDDGEPHGTAGRPMMTVLQRSGLGDIAAVVSRWFGGTKLGTGGLVKAYGGSVQQALETVPRSERVEREVVMVEVDYAAVAGCRQLWRQHDVELLGEVFGASVRLQLGVPTDQLDALRRALGDLTRGRARVDTVGAAGGSTGLPGGASA
jgi:uncharacterized YigZ family protein